MRKLMLLFVLLGSSAVAWAQDVIVKKDGTTVVCRVVEINDTEVVYKKWSDLQGANYVMERSAVSSVSYQDGKRVDLSAAKNLYKPNNQNDGTQQYNDNALLAIDRAEHPRHQWKRPYRWMLKAGFSIDHAKTKSEVDMGPRAGFEADFGLLYLLRQSNFALGLDVSLLSFGTDTDYGDLRSFGCGISPYVGYRIPVGRSKSLLPYVGFSACYLFTFDEYFTYYNGPRADLGEIVSPGLDVGLNLKLTEQFFLNAHYRANFRAGWYYPISSNEYALHAMKFVIGVGYMF